MKRIVIVGGGYAGFYTAWGLEKALRRGEAEVTVVDPAPYMTYQPFLPEVAAGSIEARHAIVPLAENPPADPDPQRPRHPDRPRDPDGSCRRGRRYANRS